MEFKEKSTRKTETSNHEMEADGFRYAIVLTREDGTPTLIRMDVYESEKIEESDDGTAIATVSAFPVGRITQIGSDRSTHLSADRDKHIAVFDEFIRTI